jgi:hypothetical protein
MYDHHESRLKFQLDKGEALLAGCRCKNCSVWKSVRPFRSGRNEKAAGIDLATCAGSRKLARRPELVSVHEMTFVAEDLRISQAGLCGHYSHR